MGARDQQVTISLTPYYDPNGIIQNSIGVGDTSGELYAVKDQRGFLGSTLPQTVNASNVLYMTFVNPVNSGVDCIVDARELAANIAYNGTVLEYQAYVNPTATLTQTATTANRHAGSTVPKAQMFWQVAPSITMGGSLSVGGFLPLSGVTQRLDFPTIIPPGHGFGYSILGSGGGALQNQARLCINVQWFEE